MKKTIISAFTLTMLFGCFSTERVPVERKTLSELIIEEQNLLDEQQVTSTVTDQDIAQAYHELLLLMPNNTTRIQANNRLAQLSLEQQQLAQEQGENQNEAYYESTIRQYLTLLETPELLENRDDILYELSKAYFLKGEREHAYQITQQLISDYPNYLHNAELLFRQGEYLFNLEDYDGAHTHYSRLLAQYPDSDLASTGRYMLAWTDFKLFEYQSALNNFTHVLAAIFNANENALSINQLVQSDRYLVSDTLHIMSVIFSFSDFEQDPVSHYQSYGWQDFSFMSFNALAEYYLEKKRYLDAANTYQAFIADAPGLSHKVSFALAELSIYQQAQFFELLDAQEKQFTALFGIGTDYTREDQRPLDNAHFEKLKSLEKRYADRTYYKAQKMENEPDLARQSFKQAAAGYQRYMSTLALRQQTDIDAHYLLAESYYQSEQLNDALGHYNQIAYALPENQYRQQAGFAVVSIYQTLLSEAKDKTALKTLIPTVKNAWMQFATTFEQHPEATKVKLRTFNLLFENELYQDVVALYESEAELFSANVKQQVQLLAAHSYYNLADFKNAETFYRALLANPQNTAKTKIKENLAASMIKQAETFAEDQKMSQAADKYIALLTLLPETGYRQEVQFLITQYLFSLANFSLASEWIDDYLTRYPNDAQTEQLQTQRVEIYAQTNQYEKLAAQYALLAQTHSDETTKRISLFKSGEAYLAMEQLESARLAFRKYAHTYTEPFSQNVIAKLKLIDIYNKQDKQAERRFWLKRIITDFEKAPADDKEWVKGEAAKAAKVFADDALYVYQNAKLTIPLKNSLKVKRKRMQTALTQYKQLGSYGIAAFTTEANYQIAQIYHQMAKDIMASERPKNLDELALEQYEILLEEQAIPFEDQAIELYQRNNQLLYQGHYDQWVKQTLSALSELMPARFGKKEVQPEVSNAIF